MAWFWVRPVTSGTATSVGDVEGAGDPDEALGDGVTGTHGVGDGFVVTPGVVGLGEVGESVGVSVGQGGGVGRSPADTQMVTVLDCSAWDAAAGDCSTTVPTA